MLVIGAVNTQKEIFFFFIQIVLYEHGQCCQCVFVCFVLRECGTLIIPKKRTRRSFFFVLLYNEDGNSHFWTLTVHTFFSCNEQNRELNDQNTSMDYCQIEND